jgi:DNA-binding transcriptional regulator YiaG
MKVTTNHPMSSYGMPVILADNGEVMDYPEGIKAIRKLAGISTTTLGELCGASRRTVENWEGGRFPPPANALNVLQSILKKADRKTIV